MKNVYLFVFAATIGMACNKEANHYENNNSLTTSKFDVRRSDQFLRAGKIAYTIRLNGKQKLLSWMATNDNWLYLELLDDSTDYRTITILKQ